MTAYTDRLEFSSGLERYDEDKLKYRAELEADVAKFLAAGGTVTEEPYCPTEEICSRVGHWSAMGSFVLEDHNFEHTSVSDDSSGSGQR